MTNNIIIIYKFIQRPYLPELLKGPLQVRSLKQAIEVIENIQDR